MKAIFLFDGGSYKRGEDDGRVRLPLTVEEAHSVFYDPEVPADSDNTIGTQIAMSRWSNQFCDLVVGDEIFVSVLPDAAVYRGLWMGSFDKVNGFTVDVELVSVRDVAAAAALGDPLIDIPRVAGTEVLPYDFTNGMCESIKDAVDLTKLWGGAWSDYRNSEALQGVMFNDPSADPAINQHFAKLGDALYIRLTVTALGDLGDAPDGTCGSCSQPLYPEFQVGAIYDRICFDKGRVRNYCNCNESLCGDGCA